jgi:hypothetical protein
MKKLKNLLTLAKSILKAMSKESYTRNNRLLKSLSAFVICILMCIGTGSMSFADPVGAASDLDESQLTRLKQGEILVQVQKSEGQNKGQVEAIVNI